MAKRILEQPYQTPDGTLDFPFAYVYDASPLTDGTNVQNIAVQLQGDSDFVLRRIMGVPLCVDLPANNGRFGYRNASGSYANGNPSSGIIFPNTWPVVPEKLYKTNTQIAIDLYNVLRSATVCAEGTIYNSQIAFMGVKRFGAGSTYPRQQTSYAFRPFPYTYSFPLTVNWSHFDGAGVVQPYQRFIQPMDSWDFELLRISISQPGQAGALLTNDFQITLYDPNMHAFSTVPLNQGFYNSGRPTPATAPPYQATFPAPTILYPGGSAIVFDITSMLCAASLPQSYNIAFQGIWRIPWQR